MRTALLLAAALLVPSLGRAQDTADDSIARAIQLQDAGSWNESRDLLQRQLDQCANATEPGPCRVPFMRTLGYVHQRQGRLDPERREVLLSRAAGFYNDVLKEVPTDRAALTNLIVAYRALGRDADLEALIRRAADQDTDRAGFYTALLGDFYERRGAWDSARAVYTRAIAAAPEQEGPRRRLVDAFAHLPADSVANLLRIVTSSPEWESRFPDAAVRAYELLVSRLPREDSATAVRACYRWVSLLAQTQLLTVERLDAVGESWLAPYIRNLEAFVVSPARLPSAPMWRRFDGRGAVAHAALALGRRRLAAGDRAGAEAYFAAGMEAGDYTAPVSLDIAVELAAFYNQHPDRDPGADKFRTLEERLLSGKAEAYFRADREAVQRFHSVLGQIYAQRGIWRSSGVPWTNAVYQLEHALETARSRDEAERSYQPLPQLRELLAEGYVATQRSAQARDAYVASAQAYLDLDQLPQASRVLERGKSSAGLAADRRSNALDNLIHARAEVAERTERPSAERCDSDAESTDRTARRAGFGEAFAQRQRFKVLADCLLAGPAPVRPADAARVLTAAVDNHVPLVGVGDLIRIQQSQAVVNQKLRRPGGAVRPPLDQTKVPPQGPALRFLLPSEPQPTYLPIDPDVVAGASVLGRIGDDPAVTSIRVSRGSVTVTTGAVSAEDRSRLQARVGSAAVIQGSQSNKPTDTPQVVSPPDDKAVLAAEVERYARALESRSLEVVRGVVPQFNARALEVFFRRADGLRAELGLADFRVSGDTALVLIRGVLRYRDVTAHLPKEEPVRRRATLIRRGTGWQWVRIE